MCEFTQQEIDRQDYVDNAIQDFLEKVSNLEGSTLQWDIEHIAIIRDALLKVVVDDLKLMEENEFYPYRELPYGIEPIHVDEVTLRDAIDDSIAGLDADDLADLAEDLLGGICVFSEEDKCYLFIPNDDNMEAFEDI